MSKPIDDGGPAFPLPAHPGANGEQPYPIYGMSLRDWFAGTCPLTPQSYAPVYGMEFDEILRHPDHAKMFWMLFADERHLYADAMLAARSKEGREP